MIKHTIKTKRTGNICFGRIDVTPAPAPARNPNPTAHAFTQASHTPPVAYVTGVDPHDQHYVSVPRYVPVLRKGQAIPAWKSPVLRDSSKLVW